MTENEGAPEKDPVPVLPPAGDAMPPAEAMMPAADAEAAAPAPAPPPAAAPRVVAKPPGFWTERDEAVIEVAEPRLRTQSRRDFLIFGAGVAAAAAGAFWLLPDRVRARFAPGGLHDRLDTLAARVGLTREARERTLDRALTFD